MIYFVYFSLDYRDLIRKFYCTSPLKAPLIRIVFFFVFSFSINIFLILLFNIKFLFLFSYYIFMT